ncbi:MAG: hypothetical protein K9J25_06580 [Bacteroidales bacterium]|nr:hypothetical protein [Bacteroidales bacterium]
MKANLPETYKIISKPSPNYYSEWYFDYKILLNDKVIEEINGNFNDFKQGELVKKANEILNTYK